ncbi:metalloprotease [Candidatus Woesearchaeota archaeon]|nr:metalloprotease [Candidatus Woesearchaeota archaeon]
MKVINPLHSGEKRILGFSTSDTELQDIFRAWVAISLAFAILLSRGNFGIETLLLNFVLSAFTVGIGFLLHELCHKVVAQYYGCIAEFRAFNQMLVLAIALSFLGFIFAAPGAVMIQGNVGLRRNGHISAAGPGMNYLLAAFFLGCSFVYSSIFFSYGYTINTWLGLFNMIPFGFFDGKKIWAWNKPVWGGMVALGLLLMAAPAIVKALF